MFERGPAGCGLYERRFNDMELLQSGLNTRLAAIEMRRKKRVHLMDHPKLLIPGKRKHVYFIIVTGKNASCSPGLMGWHG